MASKISRKSTPAAAAAAALADARPVRPAAERQALIAEAAYLRAEQRGFGGDDTLGDWLAAEREVDAAWRFE